MKSEDYNATDIFNICGKSKTMTVHVWFNFNDHSNAVSFVYLN